jgi:hypothetical protein
MSSIILKPANSGITGPTVATDNGIVCFDGTTGKKVQNRTNVVINDNGNVGIGTTVPGKALDVRAAQAEINVQSTTGTNRADVLFVNTGQTVGVGVENSVGGSLLGGATAYNGILASIGNYGLQFGTNNAVRMTILNNGKVGINETAPETQIEMTSTVPYITVHNSKEEDIEGGREGKIIFKGEQSGGEETVLGIIQFSHDGTSDDEKADFIVSVNDGNDGSSPTERLRIDRAGLMTVTGTVNMTAGNVLKINAVQVVGAQAANIINADGSLADITTKFNTLLGYLKTHGLLASV